MTGFRDLMFFAALCVLGLFVALDAAQAQPVDDGSPPAAEAPPSDTDIATPEPGDGPETPAEAEERVPPETPEGIVSAGVQAARVGDWLAVGALALMLIGWGARRIVGFFADEWASSKTGGKVLGVGTAFVTTLGTLMYATEGFSLGVLWASIAAALTAAGAWSVLPSGAKAKTLGRPAT